MRRNKLRGEPAVSVVITIVERVGDSSQLHTLYAAELEKRGKTLECVYVVDDSQRGSLPVLGERQGLAENEVLSSVRGGAFGESAALTRVLKRAGGEMILS